MKTENLRKTVKIKMIEHGYDKPGAQALLAKAINANTNSLNMALTAYRIGPRSQQILLDLLDFISKNPI